MNRDSEESESWHGLGSATGPRRRGPAPCHGGNPSQHGFKFKLFRVYHDGLYRRAFGLWRVCFPPILIRTDRRLLV